MKTLLTLLTIFFLICPAQAEQKVYYHYIEIYPTKNRDKNNDPKEIVQFLKEGWKITHVATSGSYSNTLVVYILEKENK